MDLIYKEHIAFFEISENSCKVAGFFNDRSGSRLERGTHLVCNDIRKSRFSNSWWASQQDMVQRLTPFEGSLHKHAQVLFDLGLADVFRKLRRTKGDIQ